MNSFSIEFLGHRFYPAFFILVFSFTAIIFVAISFLKSKKETKTLSRYAKITKWQKENIQAALEDRLEKGEYPQILQKIIPLINRTYWNSEKIMEISDDALPILSKILFSEAMKIYYKNEEISNKDRDYVALMLQSIDAANGNLGIVPKEFEYMGSDIPPESSRVTNETMAKIQSVWLNSIYEAINMIDDDIDKIPSSTPAIEPLRKYSKIEFEDAYSNIIQSKDIFNLEDYEYSPDETIDITTAALFQSVESNMKYYYGGKIPDYKMVVIRALTCLVDGNDYISLLNDIY